MAGISFLRARSPVTPKTTSAQGSGMRGSRRSRGSRSRLVGALSRSLMTSSLASRWCPSASLAARRWSGSGRAGATAGLDVGPLLLELRRNSLQQLVPGILELLDGLLLEDEHHVLVVDPDGGGVVEDLLGLGVVTADRVGLDL